MCISGWITNIEIRLTYNCTHLRSTKESLTFEYWRRKIYFLLTRKMDKESILKNKIYFFVEEKKKMKERRKYLEKETILFGKEEERKENEKEENI